MKILLDKYPKGTLKKQQTDGKYIDKYLYENLEVLAKKIVDDMTFLGVIFSSTLEVGTGKSVVGTQIGEAWEEIMFNMHGIKLDYGIKNIVWRPKDLIERAFQVPKYSYILLDEWEDAHYWSELGMTLRTFFRKCRQLNLFIMIIIPNWFQLPLTYAVSRSAFAIDVKFEEGFTRGFFGFYSFINKRRLYIHGKRDYNYFVVRPDFNGKFVDGYGVGREEYLKAKREDLENYEVVDPMKAKREVIKRDVYMTHKVLYDKLKITLIQRAELLGLSEKTIVNYNKEFYLRNDPSKVSTVTYNRYPIADRILGGITK